MYIIVYYKLTITSAQITIVVHSWKYHDLVLFKQAKTLCIYQGAKDHHNKMYAVSHAY